MKRRVEPGLTRYQRVAAAALFSNCVSVFLFMMRVVEAESIRYWFLLWNLVLAWLPLLFAVMLVQRLRTSRWSTWQNIGLSALWLGFLPNSFYIVSDLIHLHNSGEVSLLYDAVMFMSFIFNGYIAGLASVYLIHHELLKRFVRDKVHASIGAVLLLCGFAIYLGRNLRWNTWDVLVNPAGILFDVSERVINPGSYDQAFITTIIFFLLLSAVYAVAWNLVEALRGKRK